MKKSIFLVALFGLIFVISSCGKAPGITVSKYFDAMKIKDKDTMAAMAVDPKALETTAYEIVSISEPEIVPLELADLNKKMDELKVQKQKQVDIALEKNDAVEDLKYEIEETSRRAEKIELEKKLEEAKAVLETESQKVKKIQLHINRMQNDIDLEKNLIRMSTGRDENLQMYTGETHKYKVVVKATLTSGETKEYIFLLRKSTLTLPDVDRPVDGRLVITKIATQEELDAEQKLLAEEEKETEVPPAAATDETPAEVEESDTEQEGETN